MKLAANDVNEVFGQISPPPGSAGLNQVEPAVGLSNLIIVGIQLVFFGAGIALLIYLFWGAFDWVSSGGEKENLEKARNKLTHAITGIFMLVIALTLFAVITGNILGIVDFSGGGFQFRLPTLNNIIPDGPPVPDFDRTPPGGREPTPY